MTATFGAPALVAGAIRKASPDADVRLYLIPLRTVSVLNSREHWRARHRRVKTERAAVAVCCRDLPALEVDQVARITLTRIAPRQLDGHDNLAASLKAAADEITARLGCDSDRDARLTWVYDQRRGRVGEYAIQVTVAIEREAR